MIKESNNGKAYQSVVKENSLTIIKKQVKKQSELDKALNEDITHIYNLSKEIPLRVCLYNIRQEYYITIVIHHIAFDGWSINIFFEELMAYYNYYKVQSQGLESTLNLPKLPIQYKDFALWQRNYLTGSRLRKQLSYWKNKLKGYETVNLINDKLRPNQINYRGKEIQFELDEKTSISLREQAKKYKVSLYSLLLSAYYLTLRLYSNQDDIVIGSPVANRHYAQVENLIGFFVNSLALRIKINAREKIKDFIQRVGKEVIEAQLHQDLPFEKIVDELETRKDTSRHPIFQIMFIVQGFKNKTNQYNQSAK